MRLFEFVIAITAIVLTYQVLMAFMKKKRSFGENSVAEEAAGLQARIDELEERIRVLERIVTDDADGASLRDRFRDL